MAENDIWWLSLCKDAMTLQFCLHYVYTKYITVIYNLIFNKGLVERRDMVKEDYKFLHKYVHSTWPYNI